jgi:hypothetical protein
MNKSTSPALRECTALGPHHEAQMHGKGAARGAQCMRRLALIATMSL